MSSTWVPDMRFRTVPARMRPWTQGSRDSDIRYIALQAREGDYAVFLRKQSIEVEIDEEKYLIVSHSSILLLLRDEDILT